MAGTRDRGQVFSGDLPGSGDGEGGRDGGGSKIAVWLGASQRKVVISCSYGAGALLIDLGEGTGVEAEGEVFCLAGGEVDALEGCEGLFGSDRGLGRDEVEFRGFVAGDGAGVFQVGLDGEGFAGFQGF